MKLITIDKSRYRKHLNQVIIASIISLTVLSLGISTSLIYLFTDGQGSHFSLNLTGVVLAVFIITLFLKYYQNHDFLIEVKFVWELKQVLNKINRYHSKIELAASSNDPQALLTLLYSYKASSFIYQLDDNTLTMSSLNQKISVLENQIEQLNLDLDIEDFNLTLLDKYK